MRSALRVLVVLALASSPALAGTAVFEVVGTVASASVNSGPFVGTMVGMPARLTFQATTPGTDVAPGQYTNYGIVLGSVTMTIGANPRRAIVDSSMPVI